jgi:hypothetical protein
MDDHIGHKLALGGVEGVSDPVDGAGGNVIVTDYFHQLADKLFVGYGIHLAIVSWQMNSQLRERDFPVILIATVDAPAGNGSFKLIESRCLIPGHVGKDHHIK